MQSEDLKEVFCYSMGSIASGVIGLANEEISDFLHHKRHKALHKAVKSYGK